MLQVSQDFRAEADELHAFLETLADADWKRPTLFMGWTPWDVVAHLHFFDEVSLLALTDERAFSDRRKHLIERMAEGITNQQQGREAYGRFEAPALLERWIGACHQLAQGLGEADPKQRLPWFGPDMGVPMFTTARYMETWAHGQAVYDLLQVRRTHRDRIRNVAVIGIKTFGWTFVNRGLEAPGPTPYVRLIAPSGETWEWGEPDDSSCVCGDAIDFCQTVTQTRNVADTGLEVRGDVASQWMAIAQCFAGGPVDPPAPGQRKGA